MRKHRNYWTKEKCHEEALKYTKRSDFEKNSITAYSKSRKNKWLDNICNHMKHSGNLYKRCIYSYEFSDGKFYVGLTYNIDIRDKQHKSIKNSSVYKHIDKTKLVPILNILFDYTDIETAKKIENIYLKKYISEGWITLNRCKTGAVGSLTKWTKEKCIEEASKYKSIQELRKKSKTVYKNYIIYNLNILTDNKITKEKCIEEALKYNNRLEFKKNASKEYFFCRRNKIINEVCSHMKKLRFVIWTKEKCQEESLKYNNISDFKNNSGSAYYSSYKNKWLDEICTHMTPKEKPKGYWTKEKCQEEALKYTKRREFSIKSAGVYSKSRKNKWLDEICAHMKKI